MVKFTELTLKYTLVLFTILFLSIKTFAQLAPISPPTGGFNINGGLKANTSAGDWVAGSGGGGFVLANNGIPENSVNTGLTKDTFNSSLDYIFTTGSKFNDVISDLSWTQSTAPNKNDIHNGLYHVSTDPGPGITAGEQWVIIGGDRLSTSGTSYIDFEFLQNTLTRNASGGRFIGLGPDGGRTLGDLVISMEYTGGGSTANVYFYRWSAKAGGGYEFKQFTPPSGTAFAKPNTANEDVPFRAFGTTVYAPYAFVEGAINITKLLSSAGGACAGLSIKTLWIKTKASSSPTAALKDFMEPLPVSFTFGSATIHYADPFCSGTGTANVTRTGTSGGTYTATPAGLSIDPNSGQITLGTSTPNTYTVTYSFNAGGTCEKTATTEVIINPPTQISTHPQGAPYCNGAPATPLSVGATGTGTLTYKWYSNTTNSNSGGTEVGTAATYTPSTVNTGTTAVTTYYYVVVHSASCGDATSNTAAVTVNPSTQISSNPQGTSYCNGATATALSVTATGTGTLTYKWYSNTTNSNSGGTQVGTASTYTPSTVNTGTTAVTTYYYVVVSSPTCGSATSTQTGVTINPSTQISANPQGATYCNGATATALSVTATGTGTLTYKWYSNTTNSNTGGTQVGTASTYTPSTVNTGTTAVTTYYYVVVSSPSCGDATSNTAAVTVNAQAGGPDVTYVAPSCTETSFKVEIRSPQAGTYTIRQLAGGVAAFSKTFPANKTVTGDYPNGIIRFEGLTIGKGYSVTLTVGDCTSSPTSCGSGDFYAVQTTPTQSAIQQTSIDQQIEIAPPAPKVSAAPNPYSDRVRFGLKSFISGQGTLELYNLTGQKIKTIFSGYVQAGRVQNIEYNVPEAQRSTLIYIFRVGDQQATGKLIGSR